MVVRSTAQVWCPFLSCPKPCTARLRTSLRAVLSRPQIPQLRTAPEIATSVNDLRPKRHVAMSPTSFRYRRYAVACMNTPRSRAHFIGLMQAAPPGSAGWRASCRLHSDLGHGCEPRKAASGLPSAPVLMDDSEVGRRHLNNPHFLVRCPGVRLFTAALNWTLT